MNYLNSANSMYYLIITLMYTVDTAPVSDQIEYASKSECIYQSNLYAETYDRLADESLILGYALKCVKV